MQEWMVYIEILLTAGSITHIMHTTVLVSLVSSLATITWADSYHANYLKIIDDCRKEHGITDSAMEEARKGNADLNDKSNMCASTCVAKAMKIINEEDELDVDVTLEVTEKLMKFYPKGALPCKEDCSKILKTATIKCADELKEQKLKGCQVGGHIAKCTKEAIGTFPM